MFQILLLFLSLFLMTAGVADASTHSKVKGEAICDS